MTENKEVLSRLLRIAYRLAEDPEAVRHGE
jgi:hypothetical protein